MSRFLLLLFACCWSAPLVAQKHKADSLRSLLSKEKVDSNKVTLMWRIADATNNFDPDSSLVLAQQAFQFAREIGFVEGESRSLGIIANSFLSIGNYPRAMDYYIQKLKIEEKRNNHRNLASAIMNIGVVYVLQEEYRNALVYYFKADSIINQHNIGVIKYQSNLNIGDAYDRLNSNDTAFIYYHKSLELARQSQNLDWQGTSMVGLGHNYAKKQIPRQAIAYYRMAIPLLESANDEDMICEAALGLARVYEQSGRHDSSEYFARISFNLAKKDGFQSRQLVASDFLTNHFRKLSNTDSAYMYLEQTYSLKDSLNSKERIREAQVISSNEQIRQLEMLAEKERNRKDRADQLQYLFISVLIPVLFLITLVLNHSKIHIGIVKFLGIISLLIFFEFLTLLLHPKVANLTHHNPVLELMVFVCIASLLIPAHHKVEHWLVKRLTNRKDKHKVVHASDNFVQSNLQDTGI